VKGRLKIGNEPPYFNEACANCGIPADLHLGPNDPIRDTPHTVWGDRNKCRTFVRYIPPKAAYGIDWWNMTEQECVKYFGSQLSSAYF
jgi:hypothetical protein